MAIALVVEDGSKPEGANTYSALATFHDWLRQRHPEYTISEANADKESAALIQGFDYLNGIGYYGKKAAPMRIPAFPRVGMVDADGYAIPSDKVPPQIPEANNVLAWLVIGGTDLQPVLERGGRIASDKVSSLATSYFDDAANRDVYAAVADLLNGLAYGFDAYSGAGESSTGFVQGKVVIG